MWKGSLVVWFFQFSQHNFIKNVNFVKYIEMQEMAFKCKQVSRHWLSIYFCPKLHKLNASKHHVLHKRKKQPLQSISRPVGTEG